MTYTPIKPDAGPSPQNDAAYIRNNFAQFSAIFARNVAGVNYNHVALNASNQGSHHIVLMEKQTADPTVDQDLVTLYAKDASSKAGTQPQVFARIQKFLPTDLDSRNVPNKPMQLTYNQVNTAGPNQYQSFLAGGFIVYFGTTTNITVNITVSPAPTSLFLAIASSQKILTGNVGAHISTQILSTTTFKINSPEILAGDTVSWVALGTV